MSASAVPPLVAQLLYNRGIKPDEIEPFLAVDHRLEGDPFSLPDMPQAVNRIYKALLSGEKIAIYGDFDVDGITATAVVAQGLLWLGGKIIPYIPDRFDEGHGLGMAGIRKLKSQGASLVITVDCGVTNSAEVKQAEEMGIDVIITDHHLPSAALPQAVAVVNPKRGDSRYPYTDLAGVGVAFKFIQALFHRDNRESQLTELLDLVALGTVTDVVSLLGENRYLVKEGLRMLNNTRRPGLQEMVSLAGLRLGELDTASISWTLGPRLNAAGRMDDANVSYCLLTTNSLEEAHSLAEKLEKMNAERQRSTEEALAKVRGELATKEELSLLIEGAEDYPIGVIGLVAGRLMDEFYKPVIILNLGPELCRGSSRSIPEFNIVAALEKCSDLLISFGGHPLAAGFTVARQDLAQLEERLMGLATSQLAYLDLHPGLIIDAEIPLSALAGETFSLMQKLSPFGQANPQPTFLSRNVEVAECRNLGNKGGHLELKLKQENVTWRAVAFRTRKASEEIPPRVDVVYRLEKGWWNGEEMLQLNLRDIAPSRSHP